MFSIDKASGEKGGDLGTFGRGTMIPAFDDVVLTGKKGDIKVLLHNLVFTYRDRKIKKVHQKWLRLPC
jgi:hypothetical protein